MTDSTNLIRIVQQVQPDEIYNLAAQSHVAVSFETPEYTANSDALGTLRLLEAIRILNLTDKVKFYQASTSEMFGKVTEPQQNEQSIFHPRSPYGVAKLYAYWITVNYREAYGMFATNGILFNHESPRRGETFVTRKITRAVSAIRHGQRKAIFLGNLNSMRDWGHAEDYVLAQWQILQQDTPKDYVIATGEQYSVREFCERCFKHVGVTLTWQGSGVDEIGVIAAIAEGFEFPLSVGDTVVRVDAEYFRPSEVETLCGDASKARKELGWLPRITFDELVSEMMEHDLKVMATDVSPESAYI